MSYAVVAAEGEGRDSGCDCEEKAFAHHLSRPGVHLFTANWCGHCRRMKENIGQDIAKYYEHEESTYDSKALNGTKFEVEGYPTIYFVGRRGIKKYEGERTKDAIDEAYASFLKKKTERA